MLSEALKNQNLLEMATNPNVGMAGKKDCFIFCIDGVGNPNEMYYISKKEHISFWKHSNGNHQSFPAMNVKTPLLAQEQCEKISEDAWKAANKAEKSNLLQTLDIQDVNQKTTELMLSLWTKEALSPVLQSNQKELQGLKQLLLHFPQNEKQALLFKSALASLLQSNVCIQNDLKAVEMVKDLLVGKLNTKTNTYSCNCQTFFDISSEEFLPVQSEKTMQALIHLLNEHRGLSKLQNQVTSPLSGKQVEGVGDKYPNPNIPRLGNMYLYSRNKDIPCLTRYGTIGSESFQIGYEEADALNSALVYLTDVKKENITWQSLQYYEKTNLLLCYLPDDPANKAYLAQLLTDPSTYQDDSEEEDIDEVNKSIKKIGFLKLCEAVLGDIERAMGVDPSISIVFEILERLDKGRCQLVLESSISFLRFKENLAAWKIGAENQPRMSWKVNEGKKRFTYRIQYPGPNEMYYVLRQYFKDTKEIKKQGTMNMRMIYQLYMPENQHAYEDTQFLKEVLRTLLQYSFHFLTEFSYKVKVNSMKPHKNMISDLMLASKLISLYAITLYRLHIRKENYMKGVAYNVGQFLQLADLLHKEYNIQVRNNGNKKSTLPPQLMGNELLSIASEHPIEGINRLRERMRVYLAWANTTTGEDSFTAKWILRRFGDVTNKIAEGTLPDRFSPAEQAQVLLGYLADITEEKKEREVK